MRKRRDRDESALSMREERHCGGAPQRPGDGRVDLLIAKGDREEVSERLLAHGAHPDGIEQATAGQSTERRERWQTAGGLLTVRDHADNAGAVRDRAGPAMLNLEDSGIGRVALVPDLMAIASVSPWSDDATYLPGLRAVLASGRYITRRPLADRLQLA